MIAIDERALEAGARAVLHRRIKPDFFEVKDGAWTLDHDKVVAEAAIIAYLQALRPGSTGDWVLVPREATEAMIAAAIGPDDSTIFGSRKLAAMSMAARYRTMLAAAGGKTDA